MKKETYNGWKNYATWLIALHIDNDQALHEHAITLVGNDDCEWGRAKAAIHLREWFYELIVEIEERIPNNYLICDMINCTLGQVDWMEIADHYIETYREVTKKELG
jgi:hypothetical protein